MPCLKSPSTLKAKKRLSEIKGIAYRQDGEIIVNARRPFLVNLDELPYPAYDLVDMEQYLSPSKIGYRSFQDRAISMITSRGCPFNCCFCAVHLHMGQGFRAHSAEYVLDHIQYVVDKYKVKNIFFEDDNLTLDLKRFEAICDGINRAQNQDRLGNPQRRPRRLPKHAAAKEDEAVRRQQHICRRRIW